MATYNANTVKKLFIDVTTAGFDISVNDSGNLKLVPTQKGSTLPDALKEKLKRNKEQFIAYLKEAGAANDDPQVTVDKKAEIKTEESKPALHKSSAAEHTCRDCHNEVTCNDPLLEHGWTHITKPDGASEWICNNCQNQSIRRTGGGLRSGSAAKTAPAVSFYEKIKEIEADTSLTPFTKAKKITAGIGNHADTKFRENKFTVIREKAKNTLVDTAKEYVKIYETEMLNLKKHQHGRATAIANKFLLQTTIPLQ